MHYSYIIPTGYTCYIAISVIPSQTSIRDLATFFLAAASRWWSYTPQRPSPVFLLGEVGQRPSLY